MRSVLASRRTFPVQASRLPVPGTGGSLSGSAPASKIKQTFYTYIIVTYESVLASQRTFPVQASQPPVPSDRRERIGPRSGLLLLQLSAKHIIHTIMNKTPICPRLTAHIPRSASRLPYLRTEGRIPAPHRLAHAETNKIK